jgi:hypothetical protein
LISLSLRSTPHHLAFQRKCVRASKRCYPLFTLDMDRSRGFRVYSIRLDALFRLAFASASSCDLTLPDIVTRRLIMQKARDRTFTRRCIVLSRLVDTRFQVLFTPLAGVLFAFPSRYWCTIGRQVVFSLGRWSSRIPTGLLEPRGTQEPSDRPARFVYAAVTRSGWPFQAIRLRADLITVWVAPGRPYNPNRG